ncbi:LOW QUALITY PROTEIN: fibrinogen-like protein 1 [Phaethornis superciliosus]
MKIFIMIDFVVVASLMDNADSSDLNCFQEQILQGQVRLLEHRVKQQQLKIMQLLEELQSSDRGDGNSFIDLGGKRQYSDCAEVYNDGHKQSVLYKMKPIQSPTEFLTFYDMPKGGGWTVFQRHSDGSQNFDRVWTDYEEGFGNFVSKNGEYWLGNKNLHYLTNQDKIWNYTLRIDLTDFEGEWHFAYARFRVRGEEILFLQVVWDQHIQCHSANLNGLHYKGKTENRIVWYTWHGGWYSLKSVVMKVRPADFEPNIV